MPRGAKKQVADAKLRWDIETTAAEKGTGGRGRGGCGGGQSGSGGRIPWKTATAEKNAQHQDEVAALQVSTRKIEAERAAGREVEGRQLLMGIRACSCRALNHRDPGVVYDF
jgi:hypothetical protein